jgi:hypothetical protein
MFSQKKRFARVVCRKFFFNCPRMRNEGKRKTPSLICANVTRYTVDLLRLRWNLFLKALRDLGVIKILMEAQCGDLPLKRMQVRRNCSDAETHTKRIRLAKTRSGEQKQRAEGSFPFREYAAPSILQSQKRCRLVKPRPQM